MNFLGQVREVRGIAMGTAGEKLAVTIAEISSFENDVLIPSDEILNRMSELYKLPVDLLKLGVTPSAQFSELREKLLETTISIMKAQEEHGN